MTGRIWSALVGAGLALAVSALVTSTAPVADTTGLRTGMSPAELTTSPLPAEADAVPTSSQVGARANWVKPIAKFRGPLAAAAIVAALGLVGALAFRRGPDTRQPVPTRVRRHVIVSRGPPALVA